VSNLAINGGTPVKTSPFSRYNTIGDDEKRAVMEVLDTGILSQFLGTWHPDFYGGERVRKLEQEWAAYFGTKHAIAMNSATSGLYAAIGAAGIGPGDEVVVSPYTMAASATAALVYGAIPVFADIDPETFCLSPASIRERITPLTRGIVVVDILGHPAAMDEIMAIASEHNLVVIEDNAQGPGTMAGDCYAGTLGHMGVFSLNYHKTIHAGEGGIVVTDDDELAERLQLIRNHAEVVVRGKGVKNLVNMVGFNYRMTEIEAAIGSEQLKKLKSLVSRRQQNAAYLTQRLKGLPGISTPVTHPNVTHGFYLYALRYDARLTGVPRERFVEALREEGLMVNIGYVRPLYLEPMYQERTAFGKDGFPFTYSGYRGAVSYEKGICPVTEEMHFEKLICGDYVHAGLSEAELDEIVAIFSKVCNGIEALK
jgi:perosamine synthetase